MSKINFNEMSMKNLLETIHELFPEMSDDSIMNSSLSTLEALMADKLNDLDFFDENIEVEEEEYEIKHFPTRKKKAKRMKKNNQLTKYKKIKKGDWAKHSRKKLKDSEITNRSFNNKASKSYTPNRRHGYIN